MIVKEHNPKCQYCLEFQGSLNDDLNFFTHLLFESIKNTPEEEKQRLLILFNYIKEQIIFGPAKESLDELWPRLRKEGKIK